MTAILPSGGTGRGYLNDTVAQSFFVDRNLFITKIDLFFSFKDDTFPVQLTIRSMENGLPSHYILPNSIVVIPASSITTSVDSSIATTFSFDKPVFLVAGEYNFALSSASKKQRLFLSELGGTDLLTNAVISKQPFAGTLFKSENGVTWTADQTKDIKFILYRAKMSSTSAVVELKATGRELYSSTLKNLERDPFKSYNGSSVIKVSHNNHGFNNGSLVRFNHVGGELPQLSDSSVIVTINGIPVDEINNVSLAVSNVTSDTYTVIASTGTANVTGRFGGPAVIATTFIPFTAVYPLISYDTPPKTSIANKVKTTDTSLTVGSFETIGEGTYDFNNTKLIVDSLNRTTSMAGAESFVYRVELNSSDEYSSPTLKLPSSVILTTPDINLPSASILNLPEDLSNIAIANSNIAFSSTGVVSIEYTDERNNVKTMKPGAFVTILNVGGDPSNNGTFRLTAVDTNGSTFSIPSASASAIGNPTTIIYRPEFIAEEAAFGGSAKAKYITRKINLATPASSLVVRFLLSRPILSNLEFYYKTTPSEQSSTFNTKEFIQFDLGTLPTTVQGDFVEIEKIIENIPSFDEFVVKLVLTTSDISKYPIVKDLRIIALE